MPLNERLRRPRILLKRAFQLHWRRNILSESSTCYLETSARVLEIKVQALVNYATRECENIFNGFYRPVVISNNPTLFFRSFRSLNKSALLTTFILSDFCQL